METFQLESPADLLALVPGNPSLSYHSGLNNSELFVNSAVVRQDGTKSKEMREPALV